MSIKTPTASKDTTPKVKEHTKDSISDLSILQMSGNGSRTNSLVPGDLEVTRQFLATNKKVINRGDSFKKKQRPVVDRAKVEMNIHGSDGEKDRDINETKQNINDNLTDDIIKEKVDKHPNKIYRVAFLGSEEVGKTSIIDQFMSSEHADVYEDMNEEELLNESQVMGR